jgi:TonB family protein
MRGTLDGNVVNWTAGDPTSTGLVSAAAGAVVWVLAAGVAVRLAWLVLGLWRLRQMRRRAETPATLEPAVEDLRAALAPHAALRWSSHVTQPVTFGVVSPVVLLPRSVESLSAEARRGVVCHELLHVARRDWPWILVEELVRTAFWYHPAVWWLLARLDLSREQVVDDRVVRHTSARRSYMDALVSFADRADTVAPSLAFLRRRHLRARLQQLNREGRMTARRLVGTLAALLVVLGGATSVVVSALPLDLSALQAPSAARLEIRLAEAAPAPGLEEVTGGDPPRRLYLHATPVVTGADVLRADLIDAGGAGFNVGVQFSPEAAERLRRATAAHIGRPAAILIDGRVALVVTVRAPVGEAAMLSGITRDRAEALVRSLTPATRGAQDAGQEAEPRRDVVDHDDEGVTAPRLVRNVRPQYTREAMDAKVQGTVMLDAVVEVDGTVGAVTVTKSLDTEYGLDEEAIDAARQWRFEPGRKDGTPVAVRVAVEMTFTLRSGPENR